jgi:hypothetical protein
MPSRPVTGALSILSLCLVLAVSSNYESEPLPEKQRQLSFEQIGKNEQSDWKNVLSALPQYKEAASALTEKELAAQALLKAAPKQAIISDSQLIGIIVDKPRSVLLFIQHQASLDPVQLTLGQSWLADWQLHQINADSAVWFNIQTQQSFTQWLFSSPDQTPEQTIEPLNTTSNEIN